MGGGRKPPPLLLKMILLNEERARTFLCRTLRHTPQLSARISALLLLFTFVATFAASTSELDIRKKLADAILSSGDEQQKALAELADTGAKAVRDVLTA